MSRDESPATPRQVNPGAIPPSQRRLTYIVLICVGVSVIGGSLLVNLIADSPIDWFWLIAGCVMATAMIGLFLWIRLSE